MVQTWYRIESIGDIPVARRQNPHAIEFSADSLKTFIYRNVLTMSVVKFEIHVFPAKELHREYVGENRWISLLLKSIYLTITLYSWITMRLNNALVAPRDLLGKSTRLTMVRCLRARV